MFVSTLRIKLHRYYPHLTVSLVRISINQKDEMRIKYDYENHESVELHDFFHSHPSVRPAQKSFVSSKPAKITTESYINANVINIFY